jgi:hypothetical protein
MTECTSKLVLHAIKAYCCRCNNYNFTIQGKTKSKYIRIVTHKSILHLIIKIPTYQTNQRTEVWNSHTCALKNTNKQTHTHTHIHRGLTCKCHETLLYKWTGDPRTEINCKHLYYVTFFHKSCSQLQPNLKNYTMFITTAFTEYNGQPIWYICSQK